MIMKVCNSKQQQILAWQQVQYGPGPGVDRPVQTITEGPKSGYVQASDRAANIKCVME